MSNNKKLPLRVGVGVVLLNHENNVLVGKRIDHPKNFWQMPQGGVDNNESFIEAAKRELEEETGVKSIKLIKEINEWFEYDLPEDLLGKIWEGKYGGQKHKWFFMKFLGNDDEINVRTQKPEFLDWKRIVSTELPKIAGEFKIEIYKKLADEVELSYKKN